MSLRARRKQRIVEQELKRLLYNGTIPGADEVSNNLRLLLESLEDTFYTYEPVDRRSRFDHKTYNDQLSSAKLDIDTIYEELYSIVQKMLSKTVYSSVYTAQYTNYISKLKAKIEALTFISQNLDEHFTAVYDNFVDFSKTDLDLSTEQVVSLNENCLHLPYTTGGKQQYYPKSLIDNTHLIELSFDRFFSKNQVSSLGLAQLFQNTSSSWAYEVTTKDKGSVSANIVIPVGGENLPSVNLSEILVSTQMPGDYSIAFDYSLDKENWRAFPNYEDPLYRRDSSSSYAIEFPETKIKYFRIKIEKPEHDRQLEENQKVFYQYIFSLSGISFYTSGRISKAEYYSKALDIDDYATNIELSADEFLPPGTSTRYFVGLGTNNKKEIDYLPVKTGVPTSLGNVIKNTKSVRSSTEYSTYNNNTFYSLGVLSPAPKYRSIELNRGYQGWLKETNTTARRKKVTNNLIGFSNKDTQPLYVETTEIPSIEYNSSKNTLYLFTSENVYAPKGAELVPSSETAPPGYSVKEVRQLHTKKNRSYPDTAPWNQLSYGPHSPPSGKSVTSWIPPKLYVAAINPHIVLTGDDKPIIRRIDPTNTTASSLSILQTFVEGQDYIIDTVEANGELIPTGTLTIPQNSDIAKLSQSGTVYLHITYSLRESITSKVSEVSGNRVTLDDVIKDPSDLFSITYRYTPTPPKGAIQDTIRVRRHLVGDELYEEGIDYEVNVEKGEITRLNGGEIPEDGAVWVDFYINNVSKNVDRYFTWVYQPNTNGSDIKLNTTLSPDTNYGEKIYAIIPEGTVDLTTASRWVNLPFGWIQFMIVSKRPGNYENCLLYQVQQLKNSRNSYIFQHKGQVFSAMTAIRDSMSQVAYNSLRKNVLYSDRTKFAVVDNEIILNFEPGSSDDVTYIKGDSGDTPATADEVFEIKWSSITSDFKYDQLFVKCILQGSKNISYGVTPKVFQYRIKVK